MRSLLIATCVIIFLFSSTKSDAQVLIPGVLAIHFEHGIHLCTKQRCVSKPGKAPKQKFGRKKKKKKNFKSTSAKTQKLQNNQNLVEISEFLD